MLSKLGTKIALQRAGLGNVSLPSLPKNEKEGGGAGFEFSNPFANVQWGKAFSSWQASAPQFPIADPPTVGVRAASSPKLRFPTADRRPVVILFLRFCGCPFTQQLFLRLRSLANRHTGIHFIAVSHCTAAATDAWAKKLGGAWNVDVIIDEQRELYAMYGLGMSSYAHVLNPRNGVNQIKLSKQNGSVWQPVGEGGCRWQTGGAYAVDERGTVKWGAPMQSVDEDIMFEDGVKALGF
ncbi:hypothetical protein BU23DRAFT_655672 [Bimuria novae-zelandiae CBS 107.79]|uniref:Thioredoxin domain-containing protein n=1 Tax=Bimuria novae-zelandiae CBS 107.79 TaxID=1447943 RepID=A0A6A5UXW7_9PLEO|nr:hypothetical protein BU23DRAFT_655672 [Bimuria novae-zelandiae CBS 107.79]